VKAVDYALTLVAALLLGVGFVLQQHAAEQAPQSHFLSPKLIGDLFRKRLWLAGIGAMIAGQILAAWSIGNLELSIVEPLLTTNLLFALILAVPLSHQAVRVTEVAGALLLIAGEGLLELARSAQPIGQSFGSFSHWPLAAIIAVIAGVMVLAGRHRSGRYRASLTGLGAGLVFGIQDALTRQTLQILKFHGLSGVMQSWSIYCLVATGAVGVLLMQNAFNAGPLHSSLPTITAGEPVAGILLGIAVFGDRVSLTPSSLAIQAGGLFALVVGVILVARAPALSNLRKVVTEPVHLPHAIPLPHPHRRDPGSHHGRADAVAGGGRPEQQAPQLPDLPPAPISPVGSTSSASPVINAGPAINAGPSSPVSPTNGNGTNGLMAPAEPPRAVPPDEVLEPLETREIAEF
jgi:drug/metabolite transporter (DMT)-like permease